MPIYEVYTLQADDEHDYPSQCCIKGAIGLRVPSAVIQTYCAKYMRHGKHAHLIQRVNDSAYSFVARSQAEYCGLVQYYCPAYNLHQLSKLKHRRKSLGEDTRQEIQIELHTNLEALASTFRD